MKKIQTLLTIACMCVFVPAAVSGCAETGSGSSLSQGMEALQSGEYETAEEFFNSGLRAGEDAEDCNRGLGIALMGSGRYEEAADAFEQALKNSGAIPAAEEYDINRYLGSCYYKLGRYEEAEEVYDAIIGLRPRDADAYMMRGTVRAARENTEGMNADFQKAVDLEPGDYDRIVTIFETMQRNGCEEDGKALLTRVMEDSGSSMDDYNRGRISYYLGDYDTAKSCLEKLRDSSDYKVTIMLGKTYEALGDYNYATSVYQSYLQTDQTRAEIYNQLGLCCLRTGDYQSALSAFQSGLKITDSDIVQSLSFNEIVAYEYMGDFQRAAVLMKTYTEQYPGDEEAAREYTFLSTR